MHSSQRDLDLLIRALPADKVRFLTADRRRAYLAILWFLLQHRRSHEVEVYYDDLLIEALNTVPEVEPGLYSPDSFRADIKQLSEWTNLSLRLEPRRIETLADRGLQKFLCRIDDDTVAVLEFLEERSRSASTALSDRGRHLLRDATERLTETYRLARKLSRSADLEGQMPQAAMDDYLRMSYLCLEVDGKVDDAARELAAFDAALVIFAVSPFRLERLAEVVDRLERYVEDYVAEATRRARTLHRLSLKLLRPALSGTWNRSREVVEKRLQDDPLATAYPVQVKDGRAVLGTLASFFSPQGRFGTLLERVHGAARNVVRRVHAHVENVRARNIRIETLRDRTRNMAGLENAELETANAWLNSLFASAHVVTDLRCGTPEDRASLPRPARRYESRRAAHCGGYLGEKRGRPGQARALLRGRLLELSRFVESRILRGLPRAPLREAAFSGVKDFRSLLEAVKAHDLRSGRARPFLSYRLSGERSGRAKFDLDGGSLDAPNLIFERARDGEPAS